MKGSEFCDVGTDRSIAARTDDRPVNRVAVFVTVALALATMSLDSTIVATALPALQRDLATSISWAGWTITAYSLGYVLMLPVVGKMSDRFGRRRVFVVSVVVFTGASLACGLAADVGTLIALRAVQAAGGAGFTPSATGIIVAHFGAERDRYVGLFGSIFPVGVLVGPIFGGLFVTHLSWRAIFLVNVPVGAAILVLTAVFVPRDVPRGASRGGRREGSRSGSREGSRDGRARAWRASRGAFGTPGLLLLGIGLMAGMLAMSSLSHGDAVWPAAALGALAVVGGAGFFLHTARSRRPFLAPRLIYGRGFGAVNLVNLVYGGMAQGVVALVPLYAANRYGIGALQGGGLLVAEGIAAFVLSTIGSIMLRRTGYRKPIFVGETLAGIGVVLLALPPMFGASPFVWLSVASFFVGAGFGLTNPAGRNAGLQLAPADAATLAAVRSASMQVGAITVVSIITGVVAISEVPGVTQGWCYAVAGACYFLALPVISRIPEHRGAW